MSDVINKRFEVLSRLGEGGFGTVLLVRDREVREICALKLIRPELAADSTIQGKFAKEADPRSMTFSSKILIGYEGGKSDAFDEYARKPWHRDYNEMERHDYEWNTFHAFQGEFAKLFGPKRRGTAFAFGKDEKIEDDSDYHKYHLSLEQRHKALIKPNKKKRRRK